MNRRGQTHGQDRDKEEKGYTEVWKGRSVRKRRVP